MKPPAPFPYSHSGETDVPAYLRVRAEGLPLREAVWNGLGYLRKWANPKFSAPVEELRYFEQQRRLIQLLAGEAATGPRLAMVGDLMWLHHGWNDFLSEGVGEYLNAHPVVLGNLESPISHRFSVPWLWPDYFTYNSPPALVTSFRRPDGRNTFSALATANNHCLDRGDEGLGDTLDFLDREGILHSGVRRKESDPPYVTFQAAGFNFGFHAACWGLNNPDLVGRTRFKIEVLPGLVPRVTHPVDLSGVRAALEGMAADGVDCKIIYLHWGYEFEFYPCPDLMQVGREIVRAGADLVVGSHPHVPQPLEVCLVNGYERRFLARRVDLPAFQAETGCLLDDGTGVPRKALIAYSLGNFATAMFGLHCRTGVILSLTLARDPDTGRLDWHRPEVQLVYNVPRERRRKRRLVLLESYLRERERAGDHCPTLRRLAEVLYHHVGGA
jgi:poly-gamma-glutamate synthesis protein (capsule biosynthesis protein)